MKEVTKWLADDGSEYFSQKECLEHERARAFAHVWVSIVRASRETTQEDVARFIMRNPEQMGALRDAIAEWDKRTAQLLAFRGVREEAPRL